MYRKIVIAALFLSTIAKSYAQYAVALIPDSLKKDARVVIRSMEVVYEIKSPAKASSHLHFVATILNETGAGYGGYRTSYGKLRSVNDISGKLYDASGKEIKHIKKKDMFDLSGSDEETLMTDERYKEYSFGYGIYPYTVEFEEDGDENGILEIPDWTPQRTPGMAVEVSTFTVIAPKDYVLRYKASNYPSSPVITEKSDKKIYNWQIKNLPAKEKEVFAPAWDELVPHVTVSPSLFEAEGYKGDMSTWLEYGKFYNVLLKGRDVLPADVKAKVHELTDGLKDTREKISTLYDYMQKNSRYISIQFGIGGLQPFDATFVATKHYGDCKALSNYMVALLKEAGIKGNSVIIYGGDDAPTVDENFPCDLFNHVIACVPMQKDTMWLECTNQTLPAGYIGSFTGNRKALMVDEDGGHIVSTKTYSAKDNVITTLVEGQIDATGKLNADITNRYAGIYYFDAHSKYTSLAKDKLLDNLKEGINLATYDVPGFNYDDHKDEKPYIDEHIKVVAEGSASITGKRLFFTPNFLSQNGTRLQADEKRKFDVVYRQDFTQIDTLHFAMPEGYSVEAMPKDVSINNKFGKYEIHFKVDEGKVLVNRKYERSANRFPAAEYNDLVKFYDDMYKADRSKIVFVKKEG